MEKTFLLYLSVHWGDLIEQIKKNLSYTVPLKSKLPLPRETRLVSLETRLKRNEMSLVSNETSLISRKCTGSTYTSLSSTFKPVLCIIVTSCMVGTIFILISDACVPCVYYKNDNFLQLLAVACSWILQGTRTSLQWEVKNDKTSLRLEVKTERTSLHWHLGTRRNVRISPAPALAVRSILHGKRHSNYDESDKFLTLDNLNSKAQFRHRTFHEQNLIRSRTVPNCET